MTTSAEPVLFGARNAQMEPRNWTPLIVGFGLVLVVVALVAMLGRGKKEVVKTADSYAPNLVVEQARLSQADNFVGATVTYIDLTVKNNGTRTVVGGAVAGGLPRYPGAGGADRNPTAAGAGSARAGR